METNEQPKRKYKKHKEGFKIAVEYKLNTKLKGQVFNPHFPLYPLYVEVRAKRKNSYFRSFYNISVNPSEFEAFKSNKFIQALLEKESSEIVKCLENEYAEPKETDSKGWLEVYRDNLFNETIFEQLRIKVRETLEPILTKTETGKDVLYFGLDAETGYVAKTLEMIVTAMKPWSLEPIVQEGADVLRSYSRVNNFLMLYSKVWFSPDMHLYFDAFVVKPSEFTENEFISDRINSFKHSEMFFQDLAEIKHYLKNGKMIA